jgi:cyclase
MKIQKSFLEVILMLSKRIIAALDIKDNRVVKGVNFKNLKDAGDPIEKAREYEKNGIDEIVFLDITATNEKRATLKELAKEIGENIFIPFTVGGGIKSTKDIVEIIKSGADKVFLNSAAVNNPNVIKEASDLLGSANLVIAIDAKKIDGDYFVFIDGGKIKTDLKAVDWAKKCEDLGAGEILLTSMNTDGVQTGYDLELIRIISSVVNIPVIASGGAGEVQHFVDAFEAGADAALAASIFHYGKFTPNGLKKELIKKGIEIRNS